MYSKGELEKLVENLRKIAEYCRENYLPRLEKGDSLSVSFGPEIRHQSPWEREPKHSFGFGWQGNIWYRTGGLVQVFADDTERSIYASPVYAEDLILGWKTVKKLICEELDQKAERKNIVNNFEV